MQKEEKDLRDPIVSTGPRLCPQGPAAARRKVEKMSHTLRLTLRAQPRSAIYEIAARAQFLGRVRRCATAEPDSTSRAGLNSGGDRVPFQFTGRAERSALPLLALTLVLLAGCASAPRRASAPSGSEQVTQRLAEIFNAAETKDLVRLDSYHWYGPHFTKFSSKGPRLDAAAARDGEHRGLSALAGLKLRAEDLQIDVFDDVAVATFMMVATIQSGADAITKRERGTLVFVKHEGSWKIVHEHFSAAE